MTSTRDWVKGARPRTLWTSVAPVAVGTASAAQEDGARIVGAGLALGVALALQIASNYANDYADGIRGTDVDRIGPERLVASGKARPSAVKRAAIISSGIGVVLGAMLIGFGGQWWLLPVGALAVLCAWAYTATSRPFGYHGWGEPVVFAFFGPIAVLGTMLTQLGRVTWWAAVASVGVGLYAVSLLMVNNLRDRVGDERAGKRTLAVRLGNRRMRMLFAAVMLAPIALAVVVGFTLPLALAAVLVALPSALAAGAVLSGLSGPGLRPVFQGLAWVGMSYAALLAFGIAAS